MYVVVGRRNKKQGVTMYRCVSRPPMSGIKLINPQRLIGAWA